MIRVAINGCGRIGRIAFREMITNPLFNIVAINDLSTPEEIAHLIKYDTVHKRFHENEISFDQDSIVIKGQKIIKVYSEKDPELLPWDELNIDLVLECSGKFVKSELANKHLLAGAKKVLISAPGKGDMKTVVYGVNENILDGNEKIVSASSCTTNCLAPLLKIINDNNKIKKGFMITIHSMTNDQVTLDVTHNKGIFARRGRSASQNIIPTTSGATSSLGLVIPSLNNIIGGICYRVPTSDGSLIDVTLELENKTSIEELNKLFMNHQDNILKITFDPIVSSDIIGSEVGALVDGLSTNIVESNNTQLIKLVAWYDNEYGYTAQMLRVAKSMFK